MVDARELGEKIARMFNFIYEINGDYYILGQDYFRLCTDLEIGVYKGFEDALNEKEEDCQSNSGIRDKELVEFVQGLRKGEVEILSKQVDRAESYAQIAYQ